MTTLNIPLIYRKSRKDIPKSSPFGSCPGAMVNPQWLELSMSRTNFHGPKDVQAIGLTKPVIVTMSYFYDNA